MTDLITREAAKSLAVAYEAYHEACTSKDWNGVRVWGRMLIAAQDEAGIHFHVNAHLEAMIETAGRRQLEEACMSDIEDDGQPDEYQEWHDFDPDC